MRDTENYQLRPLELEYTPAFLNLFFGDGIANAERQNAANSDRILWSLLLSNML
jgi:hypothetical protein